VMKRGADQWPCERQDSPLDRSGASRAPVEAQALLDDPKGHGPATPWVSRSARLLPVLIYAAVFSNARFFLERTSGILSYVLATLIVLTLILIVKETAHLIASRLGLNVRLNFLTNLVLIAGSVMLSFILIETALQISAGFHTPKDKAGLLNTLTMPAEWERRPANIEGAVSAYYWHNILHVHNSDRMRLIGKFPPKAPGTFRMLALGDSLTYGYGIAETDTYPSVLEKELTKSFRIQVLNLGVSGAQSEDIYTILTRHFPALKPDLVFYGVCLNDFLPSGVGEYENNRAYPVPLPYRDHFANKTLMGKLLAKHYDALLMRWGLRADFLADILTDFEGYQARFARDVKAMNAFVRGKGLPPIVAMVLDQYPTTKGKKYEVVLAAERHLRDAGILVIASDYIKRNDGRTDWYVSRWEGHPNEKANRVFGEEIAKVLKDLPELGRYRRETEGLRVMSTQMRQSARVQRDHGGAGWRTPDPAPRPQAADGTRTGGQWD